MAKKSESSVIVPLWPNMPVSKAPTKIGVFGSTGEYNSGKSLLGLTIAPGLHAEGHPFAGQPRTKVFDWEQSCGTFQGTHADIVDAMEGIAASVKDPNSQKSRIPTPVDVFNWFLKEIEKIQPLQYDVIMVDPITDVENGLVQFVRNNHTKFGLTADQVNKGGGLIWGAVKDYWKVVLGTLSAKCQTFYFTAHLRDEFMGAVPTGKREPKGKETLLELASLYLWLDRSTVKGVTPEAPSAIVLKQRLSDMECDKDGNVKRIIQLMPPRIPVATVKAIREYINNPPDYSKLKDEERVIEQQMTEDQKLVIRAMISTNENEKEANALLIADRTAKILSMQQRRSQSAPQSPDQTAAVIQSKDAKRETSAADAKAEAKVEAKTEATTKKVEQKKESPAKADSKAPEKATESEKVVGKDSKPTPIPVKLADTPTDKIPKEEDRCTAEQKQKMKHLMLAYSWPKGVKKKVPTGETKDGKPVMVEIDEIMEDGDFINDGLIKMGCPIEGGAPKVKLLSKEKADKVIDNFVKGYKKEGRDPDEIIANGIAEDAAKAAKAKK